MSTKKVPQKSQKIARPPFLLPLPAASKLLSAWPEAGPSALCNLLAAGRGSKTRQGKARHCRGRQGDSGRKARRSKATQGKEGSCEARQSKARQGRARQDKGVARQGKERANTRTRQKGERGEGGKLKLKLGKKKNPPDHLLNLEPLK